MLLAVLATLLLLPVMELVVLIKVGSLIGVVPLLLVLVGSAVAGGMLVRQQSLHLLRTTVTQVTRHEAPIAAVIDGLGLSMAGFLLIVPGLITDAMGLLLLIPQVRRGTARWFFRGSRGLWPQFDRAARRGGTTGEPHRHAESSRSDRPASASKPGPVIEGEFERLNERTVRPDRGQSTDAPHRESPWNR